MRTTPTLLTTAVLAAALTACAPPAPVDEPEPTADVAASYPVTVENCGREVTIADRPTAVVGFDGAAETVFALDASDQLAGYFGTAPDGLPADLAPAASQTTHLGGTFPFPSTEQVLEQQPDLVLAYGFGDDGALADQLDTLAIPYLVLSEACDDPDPTVEGYLTDVTTIATALGIPDAGADLVEDWRDQLPAPVAPGDDAPVVVVYGNQDPTQPFVSTGASFVQDQLDWAGAVNAYADEDEGYLSPSWEDIASRNPDLIFSGGGGGEPIRQGLVDYLNANAALATMPAAQNDAVVTIEYAQNIPGPQAIAGITTIAEAVEDARR